MRLLDDKERAKVKKQIIASIKSSHPALLDDVRQYSREEQLQINFYGEAVLTFVLQRQFDYMEAILNSKLESITVKGQFDGEEFVASVVTEVKS